jgi:hypothetical protein
MKKIDNKFEPVALALPRRQNMKISRALKATLLVIGATTTGAMASPLLIGTPTAPVSAPKVVMAVPVATAVQTQALSAYRQIRSFWLSRAIVR